MSEQTREPKPLYLSAEEAMGLLDLCLLSRRELNANQEGVLLKLSDLVRRLLAAEAEQAAAADEAPSDTESAAADTAPETEPEPHHALEDRPIALQGTERPLPPSACPRTAARPAFPLRYEMAGNGM